MHLLSPLFSPYLSTSISSDALEKRTSPHRRAEIDIDDVAMRRRFFLLKRKGLRPFLLHTRAYRAGLWPRLVGARGAPRRDKLHIPCFPASGKASSFHCRSLPNQSMGFDLERKNGGADTEPSRLSAAAAWSKPILTTPQGVFAAANPRQKRI